VAYLAVKNGVVQRDTLTALFWANYDDNSARTTLRRTLSVAHKALNKEWLCIERDQLSLKQEPGLYVDVLHFRGLIEAAQAHHNRSGLCNTCVQWLTEAIELYRGEFLAGFRLRDELEFDNWQSSEAEQLARALNTAFDGITAWYIQNYEFDLAITYLKRWLPYEPLHEIANYRLLQSYAWSGQRSAALQHYKEYAVLLKKELGISPLQEAVELYEIILKDELRPVTFFTPQESDSLPSPASTLPVYTKPFIGRQAELRKLDEWLTSPLGRLLTITGQGGIGKTRLAVEVAGTQTGKFRDGIYLTPLQSVTPENTIVAQIANALGFLFYQSGEPKKQLLNYLQNKQLLIILDNFENCLSETSLVSEILSTALGVKLLVTSHESLNLQEEWGMPLQGLPYLGPNEGSVNDAVSMFTEYAQCASAAFSPQGQEIHIARICHILEGIPLALELASYWAELLPCEEIAQEISSSFDLLETSLGNIPQRHSSLGAVFEYSWNRLSDELRLVLRKLCIFQNGFARQAAKEIASVELPTLAALVRCSMLGADRQGRYFIPQVLKRYVEKKPLSPDGKISLAEQHSRYYAVWLNNQPSTTKTEFDNILAGWNWAIETQDTDILNMYCASLYTYYESLGRFNEGREAFTLAVEALSHQRDAFRHKRLLGKLKSRLGFLEIHLGAYDKARKLLDESLKLHQEYSDYSEIAFTHNAIGLTCLMRGQYGEAHQQFEQSFDIYEELQDVLATGKVLNNLGILANHQMDYAKATEVLQQALYIFRTHGDRRSIAAVLNNLGNAALGAEDLANAEQFFSESHHHRIELGDNWGAACSLMNLGYVALSQDEPIKAEKAFSESLNLSTTVGRQSGVVKAQCGLGVSASQKADYVGASHYFLSALHLALRTGARVTALEVLKEIADMLANRGYRTEAAQILTTVLHDPRVHTQTRQDAEKLFAQMTEAPQPAEELETIKEKILKNLYRPLDPLIKDTSNPANVTFP
jgi:DNA-binding SARP family transcriptional activator/Tfp pilus assembly protein PilF